MSASILLGIHADHASQMAGLKRWKENELPHAQVWVHALGARNFRVVSHKKLQNRIRRGLPLTFDQERSVWIDGKRQWLTFFDPDQMGEPQIFGLFSGNEKHPGLKQSKHHLRISKELRETLPKDWEPVGLGWEGFLTALKWIDREHPNGLAWNEPPPPAPRAALHDPMEIRY